MPEWFSIIIAALVFATMYFVIQIKGALKYPLEEVSGDGIAGTRFIGILFMSLVLPFVLGCYKYMVIDVIMVIAAALVTANGVIFCVSVVTADRKNTACKMTWYGAGFGNFEYK